MRLRIAVEQVVACALHHSDDLDRAITGGVLIAGGELEPAPDRIGVREQAPGQRLVDDCGNHAARGLLVRDGELTSGDHLDVQRPEVVRADDVVVLRPDELVGGSGLVAAETRTVGLHPASHRGVAERDHRRDAGRFDARQRAHPFEQALLHISPAHLVESGERRIDLRVHGSIEREARIRLRAKECGPDEERGGDQQRQRQPSAPSPAYCRC